MRRGIRALLVLAICAAVIPAWADSIAPEFTLSIPRQPLKSTLIEFSRQTGLVVSYLSKSDETEDQLVGPLNGRYTVESALKQILKDSELTFTLVGEARIAITSRGSAISAGQLTDPRRDVTHGAKPQTHQLAGSSELASQTERRRIRAANGDTPAARDADSHKIEFNLPEILVTGSRILNQDIKRSRDDIQPYVVYDRKMVEQSGARNVEDFLKQRLPMVTSAATPAQLPTPQGNVSAISLRGLGPEETLILVDGHRVAGYGFAGAAQQPDLNGIPLAAIERIEVLPTTASAIYGGSATGGVINVVLRRDYDGFETRLTYGNTFDGDASERRVDLSAGLNFNEGRTNVLVAGTYSEAGALLTGERDFTRRARERVWANNPSAILDSPPLLGRTTNISSNPVFDFATFSFVRPPLTLKDGTALNAANTFVPVGYAGIASDGGAALVGNAGQYNLDLGSTAQIDGGRRSLLNSPTIESLSMTLRHEFSEVFSAYLDAAVTNNFGHHALSSVSSTFVLPATSAANPFAEDIQVTTPAFGTDGEIESTLRGRRLIGGIGVRLPGSWQLGASYTWDRARFSSSTPGDFERDPLTFQTLAEQAVIDGTIDVLRDTNDAPPDFSGYLGPPTTYGPSDTTLREVGLQLGGPLFSMPGGPVMLSTRLEGRKESLDGFAQFLPAFDAEVTWPSRSQSNRSIYMETRLPFVSAANRIAAVAGFEVQLAARYDDYEVNGASNGVITGSPQPIVRLKNDFSSTDGMIGFKYEPIPDLAIRASYGTGFLPPAMSEVVPAPPVFFPAFLAAAFGLSDPRRGGEPLGDTLVIGGGNPNLDPEESETLSIGFVVEPSGLDGLRVGIDWTRLEKTDVITLFNLDQATIVSEQYIPELVTRAPAVPGDPFGVGPITELHPQYFNIARRDIESYDVSLDYSWATERWGSWSFAALASWLRKNESQTVANSPVFDDAGYQLGLDWRGNATLAWELGAWSAAWTTHYYDSYKIGGAAFTSPTALLNQGSSKVPSQTYHDVVVSYRVDDAGRGRRVSNLLSGVEVQLGIRNVFDKEPPIDVQDFGSPSNLYSVWGDPRLRSFYLSLRKAF